MSEREEKFERMLYDVQTNYKAIDQKMEKLRAEEKTKTASYKELLGNKLILKNILTLYKTYGLID